METTDPSEKQEAKEGRSSFWELLRFAIIALAIIVPVKIFIAQPFLVSGSSMVPTFENKDYLIIDELSYRFKEPERHEVVVFRYPNDPKKFFIKRIIGLPRETVEISGNTITIKNEANRAGFILEQPYVKSSGQDTIRLDLKAEEYFVMGDNRTASSDSRYWGAVPRTLIVGRAFLRLWPFTHVDIWPGKYAPAQ